MKCGLEVRKGQDQSLGGGGGGAGGVIGQKVMSTGVKSYRSRVIG